MRPIGLDPREAINAVQDILHSTRPIAEQTFFSMLKEGGIKFVGDEYILFEADEEVENKSQKVGTRQRQRSRSRRMTSVLQKKQGSLNWAPDKPEDHDALA